jgi:hypothetical protein
MLPVAPGVLETPAAFDEFISMNPPGVTAADAEPEVPGAPLPIRHPVTVIDCGVPVAVRLADVGDCVCPAVDCG